MTRRWLAPGEWATRLQGTELEAMWPLLRPESDRVVVVEAVDGTVVAALAFYQVQHADGLWVRPDARASRAVWGLLESATNDAMAGRPLVIGATRSDLKDRLVAWGGQACPGAYYVFHAPMCVTARKDRVA